MSHRLEVYQKEWYPLPLDHHSKIQWITRGSFYKLYGDELSPGELQRLGQEIFSDPIVEECFSSPFDLGQLMIDRPHYAVEISFLGGVTDNAGRAAEEAISMIFPQKNVRCASGTLLFLKAEFMSLEEARELAYEFYANKLIQSIAVKTFQEFQEDCRFDRVRINCVSLSPREKYQTYDFNRPLEDLFELNQKNVWALNKDELLTIQQHYKNEKNQEKRRECGLPGDPTDVEIEILAQTWSEHCKHKIFAAEIDYSENELPSGFKKIAPKKVRSLYNTYIKGATRTVQKNRDIDWAISVFSDNAGIVRYSDRIDVAIKVETHNSPSALDPYGGALTGIVGVNRDILGVGLGARPVGNTNVLCFAPTHWPAPHEISEFPLGLLHPKRVLQGVHKGIEDGGNKSGIPTINGAIYFDYNYAGKPLVFCGTVGVLPPKSPSGRKMSGKYHYPGCRVVLAGGKTGVDGIHGATFSSLELDESSPSTAVQIGDPLTQRRVTDFMMEAQKRELFESVTDNGAGGLSSSVGEMAQKTGGARVDVALVPTKYPNIRPFEIIISESQERMTFAVAPEKLQAFISLARDYDVEATDIGEFTDHGFFEILNDDAVVGILDMDFLHNGLPPMQLSAHFSGEYFHPFKMEQKEDISSLPLPVQVERCLRKLLSSPNIASKEKWVRQYDHEVQAATVVKPFVGSTQEGPGNSGVIALAPHGGREEEAIAIGCGINPRLSFYDTYLMTQYAVDEAVRNLLCQGVDPDKISLVDNFCWPDPVTSPSNPDGKHKLAQLLRACEALYDMSHAYGLPYVSGKDSMKNDFTGKLPSGEKVKISVPPTLLITALGYIDDTKNIVTSCFKREGDAIAILRASQKESGLKYSEWDRYFTRQDVNEAPPPYIEPQKSWSLYQKLYRAIQGQWLESCHDVSDGGLLPCLVECCFGNNLGAMATLDSVATLEDLFSESASQFVISTSPKNIDALKDLFGKDILLFGQVVPSHLKLDLAGEQIFNIEVSELKNLWRTP